MRLVDFLVLMLEAHARTLQRLAALMGEDVLIELLEAVGETSSDDPQPASGTAWFEEPDAVARRGTIHGKGGSAYAELESSVHELGLAARLEFHLWAYPHYRTLIESPLELEARMIDSRTQAAIDEESRLARGWLARLPIPPELWPQAERAAEVAWVRFRTEALKKAGKRPLGAVLPGR